MLTNGNQGTHKVLKTFPHIIAPMALSKILAFGTEILGAIFFGNLQL